ncbi:MAG: hypothetical protein LBC77_05990 [Spirochaetaceae bacterium]|jgi:hypothetical protein|nr:hypothetical protein [Spirochaetaceae bacterium]
MKHTLIFALGSFALSLFSCGDDGAIKDLLGVNARAPVYQGLKVVSGSRVEFYFSAPVKVCTAAIAPKVELESSSFDKTVALDFAEDHSGGKRFVVDIIAEDANRNTLHILVPFRTRNDRVPSMVINEARLTHGKTSSTTIRSEFLELKMLSAGNLGALRLFVISADAKEAIYEFPPVEVAQNEYVILHMRTNPTDNGIDELGKELNLATALTASETPTDVRDLWIQTTKKLLHATDVVYIMNQDDKILDALVLSLDADAWKKNSAFKSAAELLARQGMWLSKDKLPVRTPQDEDAVNSTGSTGTKTVCRYEGRPDTNSNADWYICNTSKHSPGKPNRE